MAITKPNLTVTGSIDAFVGSFDSDDLLRADFTKEPTLEELDSIIANFDALDSLATSIACHLTFLIEGAASLAVTATGTIQVPITMSAAASVAVTATTD